MYERKISHPESLNSTFTRKGFWFHIDGALACSYMPFVEMGYRQGLIKNVPGPAFDFRLESVSSIATSAAKHGGSPLPSGIYLTKTGLQLMLPSSVSDYPLQEPTFSCSRNAHIPAMKWLHISSMSFKDEIKIIANILEVADFAEEKLRALQNELGQDLWVTRTRLSLAIYFKRPNKNIFTKYSLSGKTLYFNGELRDYCHIYVMRHVQRESIDGFIADLRLPGHGAFPVQNPQERAQAKRHELMTRYN